MHTRFARFTAALLLVALTATPLFAARGSADFTRFVAIGDSYGAGFVSNSLNERHQPFSWPAIIARQVGKRLCTPTDTAASDCFAQPLVSFPGIGPELVLTNATVVPPTIVPASTSQGAPLMNTFGRPFNNLSIPGATVTDVISITGRETNPTRGPERLAQFILRGLGTEVEQAIAQQPTFIAIWIGGNDLLGAVGAGTPALLTPVETFRTSYNTMLDRLIAGAPNAGMVVGNLPTNASAIPLLSTVPAVLVNPQTGQPVLVGGQPVPLIADLGGGTIGPLPAGSRVLLTAASRIATGFGIPPSLANVPPFSSLANVGRPLSDNDVLTTAELNTIRERAEEFNRIINTAAQARDIPVADIAGLFDRVNSGTMFVGPFNITGAYVRGGFFSFDGVHPTDLGYILFANEYIKAINRGYDAGIPVASIAQLMTNNGAFFGSDNDSDVEIQLSPEAAQALYQWWNPIKRRMRAVTH